MEPTTAQHATNLASHAQDFPGFFRGPAEWENVRALRGHTHHLQRAWDSFDLSAVFCVERRPSVYFKSVTGPDPRLEAKWHQDLWNQGTAAVLVVEDPLNTRIYSALAKPSNEPIRIEDDRSVSFGGVKDERLAEVFETAALALEIRQFLLSIQTGSFYRERPNRFRPENAVDVHLLNNLTEARDRLISEEFANRLEPEVANAFLGRCLFTTYLIERGVIGEPQLKQVGATPASTLRLAIAQFSDSDAIAILFRLFQLLDDDFNGTMFGSAFSTERSNIRARHIGIVRQFLRGDDIRTGQLVLFDLYDFHFIPIELISAIYEKFIANGTAKGKTNSNGAQRASGAYYTPPRLADLVVDIATEDWQTFLDKRCLDPACGSGIFLVVLFQRMAAEWRRLNSNAGNVERARRLREILTQQLCGVDVDPTACMVACFSLYLAFLDQLENRDIWDLKEALESTAEGKVLPALHDSPTGRQGSCPVILQADFFSREADRVGQFDLVIGNPPWIGRNQPIEEKMKEWLFDGKETQRNPFLSTAPRNKTRRLAQFLPQKQSAAAYMWKVPLHLVSDGVGCLVLPSRVILSNQSDEFQSAWFRRFSVEAVWQLADYSFVLFNGADCPAIVAKFRPIEPDPNAAHITYYTPKVERLDPRQATIVVSAEDRKSLRLADLLAAAKEDKAYAFWKLPFWGTERDQRLLGRLRRMPTLGDLAGEPGEGKRWVKGKGLQPMSEADVTARIEKQKTSKRKKKETVPWWDADAAFLSAKTSAWGLVLRTEDTKPFGSVPTHLRRLPDRSVFTHPLVLVNDGFSRIAFSDFDVLFQHSIGGIAGPKRDTELLLFLTALLNSPLATYYLFHTSANWGVERDKVHFEELLQMPFVLPTKTANAHASRAIIKDVAARLKQIRDDLSPRHGTDASSIGELRKQAIKETNGLVYRYFELTPWERSLVEDTCSIFEPSSTPASIDSFIPTLASSDFLDRKTYTALLCRTINRWASRSGYTLVPSAAIATREGLALLTLEKKPKTTNAADYAETSADRRMSTLIERVAEASVQDGLGGLRYLRGFALFEDQQVHILKPLARRHWTRTAALNDADELADFIANMGKDD